MSSNISTLKSYLVSLGFETNTTQFNSFQSVLKDASSLVQKETTNIASTLLKWEIGIVGMFTAIGGAVVATVDKVAMADQSYRLFGERMFMDTAHARSLQVAMKALDATLEEIAFDPELHGRFVQLQQDQKRLGGGLGGDYETTMRQIRDIRFEFTRFEVEIQYLLMGTVGELFKQLGLGSGDFLSQLRRINEYIIQHIPEWKVFFATYLKPILLDILDIMKQLWQLMKDVAEVFDDFMSVISGDKSIQGVANMEKFAKAVGYAAHDAAKIAEFLTSIAGTLVGIVGGGFVGGSFGAIIGGVIGGIAGIPAGPVGIIAGIASGMAAGGALGTVVGAVGGGVTGGIFDLWRALKGGSEASQGSAASSSSTVSSGAIASGGGSIQTQARALADSLSTKLNVPADILYSQFAHETNNFTNRGATQLHNLAGVRIPGSKEYRNFNSFDDFGNYYSGLIHRKYSSAIGSHSVEDYASSLKRGGYFEDSLSNYEGGLRRHLKDYGSGGKSDNSISVTVNVANSNADPHQIASMAAAKVKEMRDAQIRRNIVGLTSVYG